MNIGTIVTRALNRVHLSVSDVGFRDMAKDMLDEVIQEHWNFKNWRFRIKPLTLTTAASTTAYALDKRVASVGELVPNSIKGSDPYRNIEYIPSHEFKRLHSDATDTGDPYKIYESEYKGVLAQPSAASTISFVSSLSNYTTGTVTVVNGSSQIIFAGSTITLDMLGRWIRVGSDTRAYRLMSKEGNSSTIFYLDSAYEGADATGASFALGDIQQKCTVLGYVAGYLQEEEIQLNGATASATTKSFTSLVKISKSGKTHGYVTATSNTGAVTNLVLDPGETEIDIQFVNLYPIPTDAETINYDAYIRHPYLYKESDSPLFPSQYHNLLSLDLYIKLETEWNQKDVSEAVIARREGLLNRMVEIDNSTDSWTLYQQSDESNLRVKNANLPAMYGTSEDD